MRIGYSTLFSFNSKLYHLFITFPQLVTSRFARVVIQYSHAKSPRVCSRRTVARINVILVATLRYLFTSKSEGVQDYICNRIYSLPEKGIEMYLSQMISMVCERKKGGALERCIIDLCSRSLQLAVKVSVSDMLG